MNIFYCLYVIGSSAKVFKIETMLEEWDLLPHRVLSMAALVMKNPDPTTFVKDRWGAGAETHTLEEVLEYLAKAKAEVEKNSAAKSK